MLTQKGEMMPDTPYEFLGLYNEAARELEEALGVTWYEILGGPNDGHTLRLPEDKTHVTIHNAGRNYHYLAFEGVLYLMNETEA